MDVCAFVSGNICVARKDIKQVAMGRTKTDLASGGENFQLRMARAQDIFSALFSMEKEKRPGYIFPVVERTKKEIWDLLPKQVRVSTWYCRYPQYDEKNVATPCNKCPTCKEVEDFVNEGI